MAPFFIFLDVVGFFPGAQASPNAPAQVDWGTTKECLLQKCRETIKLFKPRLKTNQARLTGVANATFTRIRYSIIYWFFRRKRDF